MTTDIGATTTALRTPRAAGIAGIVFAGLSIATIAIIRRAETAIDAGLSAEGSREAVYFAANLIPFAGVAFLWFIGVVRSRLADREDRFFATVFLGSGIIYVASQLIAAAVPLSIAGAMIEGRTNIADTATYEFARRLSRVLSNVVGVKMAAVFMFSTSTMALRTGFLPRWVAISGFAGGLVLLVVITSWLWIGLLFPAWILAVSLQILISEFH